MIEYGSFLSSCFLEPERELLTDSHLSAIFLEKFILRGQVFNYGIIGSTLFLAFIWSIFRSLKEKRIFALTLGPFIYGFFTYNLRNWYFWVGLAVIYSSSFMWRGHLRKHVINGIVQARPNMLYKASKNATNIRTSCPEDSR